MGGDPFSAFGEFAGGGGGVTGGDAAPSSAASDLFSDVTTEVEFGAVTVGSQTGGTVPITVLIVGSILVALLWLKT